MWKLCSAFFVYLLGTYLFTLLLLIRPTCLLKFHALSGNRKGVGLLLVALWRRKQCIICQITYFDYFSLQWSCSKVVRPWHGLRVRNLYAEGHGTYENTQGILSGINGVIIKKVCIFSLLFLSRPSENIIGVWNLGTQMLIQVKRFC